MNDAQHAPRVRTDDQPDHAKPLRSDARRNRAKLLDVAEEVFAEKGTTASTEEVARRAGVGIGTVFRHFPTKQHLLEAVFAARLRRLADTADELGTAEDPGGAFFAFFTQMVEHARQKNAFADALSAAGVDVRDVTSPIREDFRSSVTALLTRAQDAGAVRPDIGFAEVITLMAAASHAAEHPISAPDVRHRALIVVLDGLRPHGGG